MPISSIAMAASNGGFLHTDPPLPAPTLLQPWLSNSSRATLFSPPSPSVTLSLSPLTVPATPPIPLLNPERLLENSCVVLGNVAPHASAPTSSNSTLMAELSVCFRKLDEGHRAWVAHKKEAVWRLRRVELQLESEKASWRRKKMEEIESKIKALREEQKATLDKIEAEYREQLADPRRDAEAKEQKLAEQWAAKHMRLTKLLEQMCYTSRLCELNCC